MFSAIGEGRSGSSDETGRRPRRRRRAGALSGAAALVAVVALALPAGALAQTNFRATTDYWLTQHAGDVAPYAVAVGDFNRDGDPDLAATNSASDGVSVLLGKPGGGSFGEATKYPIGGKSYAVAVGHFNIADGDPADTHLDLVVTMPYDGKLAVLLGKGDGTFGPARYVGGLTVHSEGLRSVAVGKIDGDFYPDLAVASGATDTVVVLHGNGDGTFGSPASYATGSDPTSVVLTDFDPRSSKQLDFAVANKGSNDVRVRLDGNGSPQFGTVHNFDGFQAPSSIAVGDFDGNGEPDLAVANAGANTVSVLAKGNGFFRYGPFAVGPEPSSVAVGNFNRDSDPDLAVAYEDESVDVDGGVSMLLGDSGTTFRRTDYAAGWKPGSVAVGDFDGDSDSDLAVGSRFRTNKIRVLLANSAPTTAGDSYTTGQDTPLDIGAPGVLGNDTDPDGDKLTVALASAPAHGRVTLNADGSFRYTPDTGASGSDSFSYTVSDGQGGWNVGTVSLTVSPRGT
jgi:hypothetical protein